LAGASFAEPAAAAITSAYLPPRRSCSVVSRSAARAHNEAATSSGRTRRDKSTMRSAVPLREFPRRRVGFITSPPTLGDAVFQASPFRDRLHRRASAIQHVERVKPSEGDVTLNTARVRRSSGRAERCSRLSRSRTSAPKLFGESCVFGSLWFCTREPRNHDRHGTCVQKSQENEGEEHVKHRE